MAPPPDPGGLLGGRYLLLDRYAGEDSDQQWIASDEVLGRKVDVRVIGDLEVKAAKDLTESVARTSAVTDARWIRVLDVGATTRGRRRTVWIVNEWVDAPSLHDLTRRGPLSPAESVVIVRAITVAIAAAHRAGLAHGQLTPNAVLVPTDGDARLLGLDRSIPLSDVSRQADVRALGGLLFSAVAGRSPAATGRWRPGGNHLDLRRRRATAAARRVAAEAVRGEVPTAEAFGRLLGSLPAATGDVVPPAWHAALRRWSWRVIPPILAALVALASWTLGKDLGQVPGAARHAAPAFTQPGTSTRGGERVVWRRPPAISSFDPGGTGENSGAVGLAIDNDPTTAWGTATYRSAHFGGQKSGTGLLITFRRPRKVTSAQLLLTAAGADIELRAGNRPPRHPGDLRTVSGRDNAPEAVTLKLAHLTVARYWLMWITSLPRVGSGFRLGVAEMALLR